MKFIVKKLTFFKVSALLVLLASIASSIHAADPGRPIRVTNMDNDIESFSLPEQVIQLSETFRSVLEAVADQDKVSLPNQYYQTMNELKSVLFEQPALVAFEADPTPENAQEVRYLLRSLKLEKRIKLLYLADHLNMPNLLALATDMVAQIMVNPGILHNILPNQQVWQAFMKKHSTLYGTPIFNNMVAQAVLRDLPAWKNLWWLREVGQVIPPTTNDALKGLAISGNGQRIVIGYYFNRIVRIVDDTGNQIGHVIPTAGERDPQVAISGDGQRIVIGYWNGQVRIVDDTGNQIGHVVPAAGERDPQVAISGDGQRIVIGYEGGLVRIVDNLGNLLGHVVPAAGESTPQVAISGDGQRIVIGYEGGQVRIVDDAGNLLGHVVPAAGESTPQVAISGDGQRIVIGYYNGQVRIVDDAGNQIGHVVPAEGEYNPQVAISGDGQRIVIGYSSGQVRIVDGNGNPARGIDPAADGRQGAVLRVAISGDGQRIVIGYSREQVCIVDSVGNLVKNIDPQAGGGRPLLAISGDGQRIVIGYLYSRVRIFEQQEPPSLAELALEQAQLIVAILQHIIDINAIPPHLVHIFNDIPEEIRNRLMQ